jgi:hypothetical protein
MTRLFFAATLTLALIAAPAFAHKKPTADCSPGYYKNNLLDGPHPVCTNGIDCVAGVPDLSALDCADLVIDLSAELGSDKATREAAKAILDACFGTAANSPCEDD